MIPSGGVYVFELAVYSISFVYSIYMCTLKPKRWYIGWLFIVLFSLEKILGAAFIISQLNHLDDDPNYVLIIIGSAFSNFVAIGILQMGILGFIIGGVTCFGNRGKKRIRQPVMIWQIFLRVLLSATIVLGIRGYLLADSDGKLEVTGKSLVQTGAGLSCAALVSLSSITYSIKKERCGVVFDHSYDTYVYCTFISMPFLIVRTIFTIVASATVQYDWTTYETFNYFNGNWAARLFMIVLMELSVVVIFCAAGYLIEIERRKEVESDVEEEVDLKYTTRVKEDGSC